MAIKKITPPGWIGLDESGQDGMIPMYGLQEIPLERTAEWSENLASVSQQSAVWYRGSRLMEFSFSFQLTVGVNVETTEKLRDYMSLLHQMIAPKAGNNGLLEPPKPARLILSNMVNVKGVLLNGRAVGMKPFTLSGGNMVPLIAAFSGVFRMLPGYDGTREEVFNDVRTISTEALKANFYQI